MEQPKINKPDVLDELNQNDIEIIAQEIFKCICNYYKMDISNVIAKTRKMEIVEVRQMAMTLIYQLLEPYDISLSTVGRIVGGKDHATVLHAIKTITNHYDTEMGIRIKYTDCKEIALDICEQYFKKVKRPGVILSNELSRLLQKNYPELKEGIENLLSKYNLEIVLRY